MNINITKKDIIWSYASQFLQFGSGMILLPLILRRLSSQEIAIWYIFHAATAFANLLDFGFQPTIMRNVSYVFSGAKTLIAKGVSNEEHVDDVDYSLLKSLIKTCKKIYRFTSFSILLLFGTFGSYYIYKISTGKIPLRYVLTAWGLYTVSVALNFYFYYYTPLLLGRGKIKESHKTIVVSKLLFVTISFVLILLGYGLVGIAIGNIFGSLINRLFSYLYFYDKKLKDKLKSVKSELINLFPIIWHNSYRMGLVTVGGFLVVRSNTFLVTYFLGLEKASQYGISLQLINMIMTISIIMFKTFIPKLNSLSFTDHKKEFLDLYSKTASLAIILYICGFVCMIILGNPVLNLIGSSVKLLSNRTLIVIFIMMLLEMNHSVAAGAITTRNEVPFVKASLFSGLSITILSFITLKYVYPVIVSVILIQMFVQLAYQNWKWPILLAKYYNINYFKLLINGVCLNYNIGIRCIKKIKK